MVERMIYPRWDGQTNPSKHQAPGLLLLLSLAQKRRPRCVLEDFTNTFTSLGRAFEVVLGADLLCDCHALLDDWPIGI